MVGHSSERQPAMHAFRVVYPFVAVRSGPGTHFEKLGTKDKGDFVWVVRLEGGWASLARPEGAWMLVDGAALDLPVLLQPVPECCVPLVPRPDDCEVKEVAGDAADAEPRPPRPPGRPRVLLVATSSHFVFDSWLDESDAKGETRRMGAPNWGRRAGGRHHVVHRKRLLVGVGAHWAAWAFFRFLDEECDCTALALSGRDAKERWPPGDVRDETWEGLRVIRGDAASIAPLLRGQDFEIVIAADGMRDVVEFAVKRVMPGDTTVKRYAYAHTFNELRLPGGAPFATDSINGGLEPAPFELLRETTILAPSDAVRDYVARYCGALAPKPLSCTAASFGYFGRDDASLPARHDLFDGNHRFVTMISPCPAKGLSVFMGLARRHPDVRFAAIATSWCTPGQDKRAKFQTSKPHISAVFHSFWLIFGRAIISRNGLEAWMLFYGTRARGTLTLKRR